MKFRELSFYYRKFKFGEDNFHNLMPFRIRRILLISTFYDAYIFEHDSLLSDQLVGEYHQLNLTSIPRMISVPTAYDALRLLEKEEFDIVITTMRTGETSCFTLAEQIKERHPRLPVVLLLTSKTEIPLVERRQSGGGKGVFDEIFLWTGAPRVFLSIIKIIEDYRNVRHDIRQGLVRVLLVVEDSVEFSSIFLPVLYGELMEQIQRLIAHEQNNHKKYLRMRTRPKILLARSYEEALVILDSFKSSMLGVICDAEFPVAGSLNQAAGFKLLEAVRRRDPHLPVLFHSMNEDLAGEVEAMSLPFMSKKSPRLREELQHFLRFNLGFGDFIFRNETEEEIARARSLKDFERLIPEVPGESLLYHARRDHFSTWLMAHGEFEVARMMKSKDASQFSSIQDVRDFLISSFVQVRRMQNHGNIVDFAPDILDESDIVVRMGKGSLGGKGRGLAFMNALISTMDLEQIYPDVVIDIPKTVILATDVFDEFLEINGLTRKALKGKSDGEIRMLFAHCRLPGHVEQQLEQLLQSFLLPLAVRSSSLLEDSQAQPFSGVYQTYMIPNASPDLGQRLEELSLAIRLVYASAFLKHALLYIENLHFSSEEEKMAVIIQEMAGRRFGEHFYPHVAGVGQSWNYYPVGPMSTGDTVCNLALGLGHMVVGGSRSFMFSPHWPSVPYHDLDESIKYSQTHFFALNLSAGREQILKDDSASLVKLPLRKAEESGNLKYLASVYNAGTHSLEDSLSVPGQRVVNFRGLLEYEAVPLASILKDLMEILKKALGSQVEIEFALVLPERRGEKPCFYLLQVRPLNVHADDGLPENLSPDSDMVICYSRESLGNGSIEGVRDILLVDPERWDHLQTEVVRTEVAAFNELMRARDRHYILAGPGRWGSRDPHLGVPVQWPEISMASLIIELAVDQYDIDASQGSHFLHNLIAMNVGYAHVGWQRSAAGKGEDGSSDPPLYAHGRFNLDALRSSGHIEELSPELEGSPRYIRHFRSREDLGIILAGKSSEALVHFQETAGEKGAD